MTKLDQELEDLIAKILMRTLNELSDWVPVKLMPGVGPQHPQVHFEFEIKLQAYRENVRSMLARKPIEELRSDYLKSSENVHNPLTQPHGAHFQLCKELNCLKKICPPWFGSGWSEQGHLLDVGYWIAATTLSINEAALLMVGVDPRKVNYEALFGGYGNDVRTDEILYFLEDCFEILVRRFGDPDDGPVKIDLGVLCEWISLSGLRVSPELQAIVQRRLGSAQGTKIKQTAVEGPVVLHGHTRAMFQRLLLVVAIKKYGLLRLADAGKVAKAMVEESYFLGFSLDKVTIAKHIRAGFSQLSEDEKDHFMKNT